MKTIEVTVRRVTYTTYEVEVDDDFDTAGHASSAAKLESYWFSGEGGWQQVNKEIADFQIEEVQDKNDNEEN